MLDIKYRFTCGDSDLSEIIKKYLNIMTRIDLNRVCGILLNVLFDKERVVSNGSQNDIDNNTEIYSKRICSCEENIMDGYVR